MSTPKKKLTKLDVAMSNMAFRLANLSIPEIDLGKLNAASSAAEPETRRVDVVMREELNDVQRGFRDRAKQERERMEKATDSEFWFCVCFQTRAQKDAFLAGAGLAVIGDKYLDGRLVAKALGVDIPVEKVPYNTSSRVDRKLAALTMTDDEAEKYGRK